MEDKTLTIKYCGRIIDQLGIQMYQSPIAAIAEMISNSWDADAEKVDITLPKKLDVTATITIKDDGIGMSFNDCQDCYLNVGYCRRGDSPTQKSPEKNRPIIGRKGIGKFAGFGIADTINIRTIDKKSGELTEFELNLADLRKDDYVSSNKPVNLISYEGPDDNRKAEHGTIVTLKSLRLSRNISESVFLRGMARRFLLHKRVSDFEVKINGVDLPKTEEEKDIEFVFPKNFGDDLPEGLTIENDGWGKESLSDGNIIKWKFCFYKAPIDEEQLRGISIFSKGKLCQNPFFFNLTGGLGGQHGQEYLSGAVEADFLDELPKDLISPERQRIDFEQEESAALLKWGQDKIKSLLRTWQNKRAEEKVRKLEQKILPFNERLERLSSSERRTIKKAITNLAKVSSLEDEEFIELGNAILTTWEEGRLRDLINQISENESLNEQDFLKILMEAQVLTALNIAEAVRTKIETIKALKDFIKNRDKENKIRDHIAENPWLISSQWETFQKERHVRKIMEDAAAEVGFDEDIYNGRIDLALSSGNQLLILEFMRPGLPIDFDHLSRFEQYVYQIRDKIRASTVTQFNYIIGYIVADSLSKKTGLASKIKDIKSNGMYALDWDTLLQRAIKQYDNYLKILASRNPEDTRLKALLGD
ncbi:MAG: ATP-binding protein [Sedimentisphaerales bacterium]